MSNLYGRNTTSDTILVSSWKTYSAISTNVSVIEVQSISDDSLFNAYKFIYNQVPYYYVVDGSHNYWVSDLSSIGYKLYEEPSYEFILVNDTTGRIIHGVESLNQIEFSPTGYFLIESDNDVIFVVELPTVSTTGDWDDGNQLYPYGGGSSINTFFAVGEVKDATTDGSSTAAVPYNSGNSYCIFDWFTKDAIGLSDVVLVNNNGNLAFSNVSDHTFNIRWFNVAVCSSNQASVITVYDSSNTAYNSFKYTIDNIVYYYVLDGTQTAWTNDLSSIGYQEVPPAPSTNIFAEPGIAVQSASGTDVNGTAFDYAGAPAWNLKVYGQNGGSIYLGTENNFMYIYNESTGNYTMLTGGTSGTSWEIVSVIDVNGNEVSKESDYIWWINAENIYYKASPTRSVSVAYILLNVVPPL